MPLLLTENHFLFIFSSSFEKNVVDVFVVEEFVGNFWLFLKVHMGTHMWSNGASRRGRRMSLDLPPIPMTPKDSEFLQRRPDLFYPYLPAPFLNGMQQKVSVRSKRLQSSRFSKILNTSLTCRDGLSLYAIPNANLNALLVEWLGLQHAKNTWLSELEN